MSVQMVVTQHILISHARLIPCRLTEADSVHHCSCKISLRGFLSDFRKSSLWNSAQKVLRIREAEVKKLISHQKVRL